MRIPNSCASMLVSLAVAAGCSSNGASTDNLGAATGGAVANGGSAISTYGGSASGGLTATALGGTSQGGSQSPSGGVSSGVGGNFTTGGGGSATAGRSSAGGFSTGGSSTGGVALSTGGLATGGAAIGGRSTAGGTTTGGLSAGGYSTAGRSATGGSTAGGSSASGGLSTGGKSTTGGAATGGSTFRPCPTDGSACKIMPFGDSITDGYGTVGAYRVELFRLALQAGKNISFVGTGSNGPATVSGIPFPPNHEGHSGWTIAPAGGRSGISTLVATVMPQFAPHIVTLMIGTNDAIDNFDMANAATRLGALIDSIYAQLPNVLIVVAQPIPSQDDALNLRIQAYDATIPAVVKTRADAGRHILLVDMYSPFAANSSYKTTLLKDTWHPNEAGHVILGARWYSTLAGAL